MKILLLGATGVFGKEAAALLAREKEITQIGLASRRPPPLPGPGLRTGTGAQPAPVHTPEWPRDMCSPSTSPTTTHAARARGDPPCASETGRPGIAGRGLGKQVGSHPIVRIPLQRRA